MDALPTDVLLQVFQSVLIKPPLPAAAAAATATVDYAALRALPLVCRTWSSVFRNAALWRHVGDECFVRGGGFVGLDPQSHPQPQLR